MSDPRDLKALEAELAKREAYASLSFDFATQSFPAQAAFINDPSKRKAALCTRRAGKSFAIGFMLLDSALKYPGSTSLYLSYTRQHAKDTQWNPLIQLAASLKIHIKQNRSELSLTLGNGSRIVLQGADKDDQIEKLRGKSSPFIAIDECGHGEYKTKLDYIVNEVASQVVADVDGVICLTGTASPYVDSLFYSVTGPNPIGGWSVHKWTWEDNTSGKQGKRVCDNIRKSLTSLIAADPSYPTTDGYKREWQGIWAIDQSELVYRFDPTKNLIPSLPPNQYRYIISVDPAWRDGTAFLVAAYAHNDPTLYILEAFRHKQEDLFTLNDRAKLLASNYQPVQSFVIDAGGGAKQGVETLKRRTGTPWKATTKSPGYKHLAWEQMNGDFRNSKIKLIAGKTHSLIKELCSLTKNPKDTTEENQSQPNDLCDAALYAWLESRHWNSKLPYEPEALDPFSIEYNNRPIPSQYSPIIESDPDDPFNQFQLINELTRNLRKA